MPAPSVQSVQRKAPGQVNGVGGAMSTKSAPVRKTGAGLKRATPNPVNGSMKRAVGGAGGAANGAIEATSRHLSPYEIMASRIMNRVGEMAENLTFAEKPQRAHEAQEAPPQKKKPRKLEMRLQGSAPDQVSFSPAFLDNTLAKMLSLQNRMLKVSSEIAKCEDVSEEVKKDQYAQTSELSRIIALICAEKARQGA